MAKKRSICIIIAAIAAALIGAAVFFATHISIGGAFFSRNAAVIDLTDQDLSVAQYLEITDAHPDKEILWTLPFQGSRYAMDTEHIILSSLTEAEADILKLLPELRYVDAERCQDYEALLHLWQTLPELEIYYNVPLGSDSCNSLSGTHTATDVTAAQLEAALPLLPRLEHLYLSGSLPQPEELLHIRTAFPEVQLICTLKLWGQELHTDCRKLTLADSSVDPQELSRMLPLFPQVTEVDITGTPLTVAQYQALLEEHPGVSFLCQLEVNGNIYSTDAAQIDISGTAVTPQEAENLIALFPRLEKLIMSDCGLDDETMDALNRKYPDISIVWTLQIGLVTMRTDALIFYPAGINQYKLPSNEELQKLRYCTELVAIDIGHSEATDCNWLAYTPHVKYLILADTNIADIGPVANLKELVYLEVFNTDITDYTPLLECTALQDLNIGTTYGDPEPLSRMTWLHNLQWHPIQDHPVLGPKAQALKEQLPDTNITLKTRRKNIGGPWRFVPNYYVFRELLGGGFYNQENINNGYWDYDDGKRILACNDNPLFAGDALVDIVRYRIDNDLPIMGIKNIGSEKAESLYQSLVESQALYAQIRGA